MEHHTITITTKGTDFPLFSGQVVTVQQTNEGLKIIAFTVKN